MNLVMLSGNSLRNRDWIYEAKGELGHLFDNTFIQDYAHWQSGDEWINLDYELEILRHSANYIGNDYGIFAKSIGTVLATQALWRDIIHPKFFMFLGIPLGYITENYPQFREVLGDIKMPLTVIHNENDTVGSAAEVKEYLSQKLADRGDYNFITTPGDTHDYLDYELISNELTRLKTIC